jgi:flagellar basal-body rod modification protein FlgD
MQVTNIGRALDDVALTPQQRTAGRSLGQEDFLRIMVEQLRHQNPLEPQDNTQFFQQIAQFESLDAMREISKAVSALLEISGIANASALIGRTVTAEVPGGTDPGTGLPRQTELVTGVVERVTFSDNGVVLHMDGRRIPSRMVVEVA